MNFENIILCKYKNCNKVYENDVILPCGKRVCKNHIDEMKLHIEDSESESLKFFFCSKLHQIPEDGFPTDELIENLLKVKYAINTKKQKKHLRI